MSNALGPSNSAFKGLLPKIGFETRIDERADFDVLKAL